MIDTINRNLPYTIDKERDLVIPMRLGVANPVRLRILKTLSVCADISQLLIGGQMDQGLKRGLIQQSLFRTRRANRAGWILFTTLVGSLVVSLLVGVMNLS